MYLFILLVFSGPCSVTLRHVLVSSLQGFNNIRCVILSCVLVVFFYFFLVFSGPLA